MKKTKKLDMWTVLSFVILLCYAVFLLYPMLNLLRCCFELDSRAS